MLIKKRDLICSVFMKISNVAHFWIAYGIRNTFAQMPVLLPFCHKNFTMSAASS